MHVGNMTIEHAQAVAAFSASNTGQLSVDDLELTITQPKGSDDAAPCARFENTDVVIGTLAVRWPAAPETWTPVLHAPAEDCSALVVHTLTVDPSFLADRIGTC
jgi:hypothetical protein